MKVFVYGTLKQNHYYHQEYLGRGGATFLGPAHTGPGFTLYVDALPHMVADGNGSGVRGEIYEVQQDVLKSIDDLEGHPRVYRREIIEVTDDNGKPLKCWAYLRPKHLFAGRSGVTVEEEFV